MAEFTIRKAAEGDEQDIFDMIMELAVYKKLENEVVGSAELLKEELFDKKHANVLLACLDGKPIGYALYFYNFSTFLTRSGIYLEDLYIKPEHRKNGYGKALLRALAKDCKQNGRGRLEWSCLKWNKPSIDFYKSLGAFEMEEWMTFRLTGKALEDMGKQ